ncbi:MAG: ATP-dependent helicase [Deltaproteobacteria bacterium]|nr:ATP-dependent helicase [Deltaproteobacteria bacterium]
MQLDAQQQAAVKTESRKAMVLAGAGAGKTRVLVERIAHLIENGASPYEITAFTFTRKAAGEIRDRLVERIGNKVYHVEMGTMHALALRMVKRFGSEIGFRWQGVTVYGEWEESFLLKEIAKEMFIYDGKKWKIPYKTVMASFARYYQTGIEPAQEDPVRKLFDVFISRCKENNALTYGGLLVGLRLLIPKLAQYLKTKHILVDEVQDIDTLQWDIINQMVAAFKASLFIVGDVDQSIYEWRGAVPEYLVRRQADYDIYRIETNYRSRFEIVEHANRLISKNKDRIEKTMRSARVGLNDVWVLPNIDSEAIINDPFITAVTKASETTAILARVHGLLQKIDTLMTEKEIPHTYIGKTTALTNSEPFRRFHAFLKLLVNPHDNFSFLLIKDLIGLPKEEYTNVRKMAAETGKSHFQVWFDMGPWNQNMKRGFFASDRSIGPIYQAELLESIYPGLSPESLAFIVKWTEENKGGIPDYLDWLATYDLQDEVKADNEGIILATIHAAKGLEWDTVIIAGMNEGILPSNQALKNGDLEAERRLAYVAMTRAKDQLILAVRPEAEEKYGRVYESPISRFISEIKY